MKIYRTSELYEKHLGKGIDLSVDSVPVFEVKRSGSTAYVSSIYPALLFFTMEEAVDYHALYGKNIHVVPVRSNLTRGIKIMWDESIGAAAVIFCQIDTSCVLSQRRKRGWQEDYRVYVFPDKTMCRNHALITTCGKYPSISRDDREEDYVFFPCNNYDFGCLRHAGRYVLIDNIGHVVDERGNMHWDASVQLEPFHKMFGKIVGLSGNKSIPLDTLENLYRFLCYKKPSGSHRGKKQDRLNSLLRLPLPDVPINRDYVKIAVIQRVDDAGEPMCVIRTFIYSKKMDVRRELGRIYVSRKDYYSSKSMDDGTYVSQALLNNIKDWDFPVINIDRDAARGTMLQYYSECLEEISPWDRGKMLYGFLKYPITERMYKIDCLREYMKQVFHSSVNSPKNLIDWTFGKVDMTQSNVCKAIGMNMEQICFLEPYLIENLPDSNQRINFYLPSVIAYFKGYIVGNATRNETLYSLVEYCDVSSVDIKTFRESADIFFKFTRRIKNNLCHGYLYANKIERLCLSVSKVHKAYGNSTALRIMKALIKSSDRKFSVLGPYRYCEGITLYSDYIDMSINMGLSVLKSDFETPEQLASMHDAVMELYNSRKDEFLKGKWDSQKSSKNWKKWEYKSGEFIVVSPDEPGDLTEEGISLHHCVKNYIEKVSDGTTNIMFIRLADEPNKPFFTVEISNHGYIEQVHGLCNCNADTYPGLQQFVSEWAKACHLKQTDYDKVR